MTHKFQCNTCSEIHEAIPDVAFDAPVTWTDLPEDERARRGRIDSETCVVDDHHFVRAVLELPIVDSDDRFAYGVWVSLSSANFERFVEVGGTDVGAGDGPWSGWLSVRIPGYPDTFLLRTRVHLQPPPKRPTVELEPTDHPLAMEQRLGVRLARVFEIIEHTLHRPSPVPRTLYPHLQCRDHQEGHVTFVCRHLAEGSGTGFFWAASAGDPWPEAWCSACERVARDESVSEGDFFAQTDMKLICHFCYEEIRKAILGK